jgi:hypothetical protein
MLSVVVERQWQLLEDDPHVLGILLHQLGDRRLDPRAERTLEVRELDDGDLGIGFGPFIGASPISAL